MKISVSPVSQEQTGSPGLPETENTNIIEEETTAHSGALDRGNEPAHEPAHLVGIELEDKEKLNSSEQRVDQQTSLDTHGQNSRNRNDVESLLKENVGDNEKNGSGNYPSGLPVNS
ncbi:hypothetical protein RhiJN_18394 [Ceratobasidium sp. AG-Ba]|nr:hypothetical protein RhiJN_18394 [Ceratobasidium sp. AG-Ba]